MVFACGGLGRKKLKVEICTAVSSPGLILIVFNRLDGHWSPRHTILLAHPLAEIDQLAAFRTEWSKGIILPLDLFVAGWTFFHGPNAAQIN